MWTWQAVPRLHAGDGALRRLGDEAASCGRRAALVAGRHLQHTAEMESIHLLLSQSGVEAIPIAGPQGEPTLAEIAAALTAARAGKSELVIAVGGGSTLDMAKAVAGLYGAPGTEADVVNAAFRGELTDFRPSEILPWIAVPTTAGTGSEATHVVVASDPAGGVKQSMRHQLWFARVIIIDPLLYISAPPAVTASAGMDALTQAIEAHTSVGTTDLTRALTLKAAELIGRNLIRAYRAGDDPAARAATALGSCLAGMALANARLGVVHGLAHPVGMRYKLAHGLTCAVLLPYVLKFNMPAVTERYAELAGAIGLAEPTAKAAGRLLEYVQVVNERLGIPAKLGQLGLMADDIPHLARAALGSGSTKANPRPAGYDDLAAILAANL